MRRALLTFGVGPHAELLEIALPSYRAFADRHGYDLIVGADPHDREPSWWKITALLKALDEGYDEVLFLGADLIILDPSSDLDAPADAWQALVEHWTGEGLVPNADVWLVRPPMRPFLEEIWGRDDSMHPGWWEQAPLVDLMGYGRGPDGFAPLHPSELRDHTHYLNRAWNVHRNERTVVTEPAKIVHATQWPDRAEIMREFAAAAAAA